MKLIARFFVFLAPIVGASYSCLAMTSGMTSGPINSFALAAKHFVGDPARHQIYASIPASGEVAVIDTATLTVKQTSCPWDPPLRACRFRRMGQRSMWRLAERRRLES